MADVLLALAADEECPAEFRVRAAARVGGLGRAHHERARALLEALVTDDRRDVEQREKARTELRNLQDVPPAVAL
ncbi:hypothetical protein [Streptomyces sp. NPDC048636]|uniref:hypothetical protein n=1 Tax=Streptomyces sp. NPDC048636 TaxID=3155762 RepID=UPI0034427664